MKVVEVSRRTRSPSEADPFGLRWDIVEEDPFALDFRVRVGSTAQGYRPIPLKDHLVLIDRMDLEHGALGALQHLVFL